MAHRDEALARLYAEDQSERKTLLQLKLTNKEAALIMQKTLPRNDAHRRELVEDLIPVSSKKTHDFRDHFYAAAILSRGKSKDDLMKAYTHVSKAYAIAQTQQNDFSEKVKKLYQRVCRRLDIPQQENGRMLTPQQVTARRIAIQQGGLTPQMPGAQGRPTLTPVGSRPKTQREKEQATVNQDRIVGLCLGCGRAHRGFCPPRH